MASKYAHPTSCELSGPTATAVSLLNQALAELDALGEYPAAAHVCHALELLGASPAMSPD